MRLSIVNSLFLTSLLLGGTTGTPSISPRQDVGTKSVNLSFNSKCPLDKQRQVISAWEDAVKLAINVGEIDFNDHAAVEFFGAPAVTKDYQGRVQAVFDSVKTFGQGSITVPTLFKLKIKVSCTPDGPEHDGCKSGVGAFTWNTRGGNGPNDAVANIHFCNLFFFHRQLDEQLDMNKKSDDDTFKYDLEKYRSKADIVLHEMMHGNVITRAANGDRHIKDITMRVYMFEPVPKQPTWRRKERDVDAYGATGAKILAHTHRKYIGEYISLNADSFAQYALAKYVQSKLGETNQLVATNGSEWGLLSNNYEQSLKDDNGDITLTPSTSEENTSATLTGLEWTPDDKYPEDYIKQVEKWASKGESQTPAPPTSPNASPHCNGLSSKIYMSQSTLADNIRDFCSQAVKQGVQDEDSGSITRTFNHGSLDDVKIAVDWPPGMKIPFNEDACKENLKQISDDCDGNDPENPMDYKGGGTITVEPKTLYHITPLAPRQPLPNKPGGSCDVRYKFFLDEFWIWGNGYATSDYGQKEKGLMQQLKGCRSLTHWRFEYGLGSDGREWSATGRVLIGKAGCVARAIASAGGPKGVDCSGDT
ncbi:hypothetical protein FQN49_003942 [Arthroderma sp. PD_2]|nr:hypothetical protein FQN49_003942 [Arthroderma sp. PD_2]